MARWTEEGMKGLGHVCATVTVAYSIEARLTRTRMNAPDKLEIPGMLSARVRAYRFPLVRKILILCT